MKELPNIFFKEHRGRWIVTTQLEDGRQLSLSLETEDDVGNLKQLKSFTFLTVK